MKADRHMEKVRAAEARESMPLAIAGGVTSAIACTAGWVAFSVVTKVMYGMIAMGFGAVIGFAVWFAGKGRTSKFGQLASGLSFLSIALGNLLIFFYFTSLEFESYAEMIQVVGIAGLFKFYFANFHYMDFLFIAIAMGIAYKYSWKTIEEEMAMV